MEPYFSRWKAYARCFLGSQASRPSFRDVVLNRGEVKDKDLYVTLQYLKWSYLKDIFSSIQPWSEASAFKGFHG
ncbi:hypothetical protein V6N11_071643 [Hibiscus sabdariffa]|uniref:Uncharacterized protein n=1 Tax=Hibiscus sabdariffa TaxID=183260 RepID=A0ABR2U1E0_9ROSI